MEGVSSEAASLAGQLELGKLIYLFDDNHVTLSAGTNITCNEDHARRFQAYGWHTQLVEDGNDVAAIDLALRTAQRETRRPSLILVRTHLGFGSPDKQDTFEAHGSPLGVEEVKLTKQNLGWPVEPLFDIPPEALTHFREALPRGQQAESEWRDRFARYATIHPDLAHEFQERIRGELPAGWDADIPVFPADPKGMKTRVASGKVMNAIAPKLLSLMGGSADLDPSTLTALKGAGDFESLDRASGDTQGSSGGGWNYAGRNLHFGIREHGMGAILNGMAAYGGIIPYGATFLIFSDYMRPPIRLAAMMKQQVIYVFTHDSIALGEDGTTHQPVEQLANLRAVPGLVVIRPCDANETAYAWRAAIESRDRPVALILTRQDVPTLDRNRYASAAELKRGAYILAEAANGQPQIILIATVSEVSLIVEAQLKLEKQNIQTRLVSMPSWELFNAQPEEYRRSVFPPRIRARLAVEAGATQGWHRYVGDLGDVLGLDHFGASAPGPVLMREYGFTVENVCKRALALLEKKNV
jgi:transketolase